MLLSLWLASSALSQAQFYQGKTLTILQSSDPGDTSDTMVRATIPVLRKHIPGEPTIAYQTYARRRRHQGRQPYFSLTPKPDGLTIGRIGGGLVANAAFEKKSGSFYDLDKLIYLGSAHSTYHWVFITRLRCLALPAVEALRSSAGEYASAPRRSAIPIISSAACLPG